MQSSHMRTKKVNKSYFFLLYPFSFTLYLKLTQLKQKVYCDVKNIDLIYCVLTFAGGFVIYVFKSYSLFTLKLF